MAVWKISDKVWWGDRDAIKEVGCKVGVVLNLAHNVNHDYYSFLTPINVHITQNEDQPLFCSDHPDYYNPGVLPVGTPYFYLPNPDEVRVTDEYFTLLVNVINFVNTSGRFPFLVHCYVGGHRSPMVAVLAQLMMESETITEQRYRELREWQETQCDSILVGNFALSLEERILELAHAAKS